MSETSVSSSVDKTVFRSGVVLMALVRVPAC